MLPTDFLFVPCCKFIEWSSYFTLLKVKINQRKERFCALCHQIPVYWSTLWWLQWDLHWCGMRELLAGNYCYQQQFWLLDRFPRYWPVQPHIRAAPLLPSHLHCEYHPLPRSKSVDMSWQVLLILRSQTTLLPVNGKKDLDILLKPPHLPRVRLC